MSKILILSNSSGGLYDFRNELLQKLLQEHEVVISLPDQVKTEELKREGCRILETAINRRGMNPLQDLKLYREYRRILRQEKPDLVLTYTIKPNIYGGAASRMAGIPYISTITGLGSVFERGGLLQKLVTAMYRFAFRRAACVFFQNDQNRRIFRENRILSGRDRLVAGSGVNLEKHYPEPYPEEEITRFLFVGRMMKEKGIEEYLEAAGRLKDPMTEFCLLGYCDEDYEERLRQAETEGIVKMLGFQKEIHDFYRRISAVVMPTYHEGMSNVLMEAAATARPVIASDISGCREIFEEGRTGIGFRPRDSRALEEALRKFLKLSVPERREMGLLGRRKMEKEFDRQHIVSCYYEEIAKILGKEGDHHE